MHSVESREVPDCRISLAHARLIHAMPTTGKSTLCKAASPFGLHIVDSDDIVQLLDPSYFKDKPWRSPDRADVLRNLNMGRATAAWIVRLLSERSDTVVLANIWGAVYDHIVNFALAGESITPESQPRHPPLPVRAMIEHERRARIIHAVAITNSLTGVEGKADMPRLGISVRRHSAKEAVMLMKLRGGAVAPEKLFNYWNHALMRADKFRNIIFLCAPADYERVTSADISRGGDTAVARRVSLDTNTGMARCSVFRTHKDGTQDMRYTATHYFAHPARTLFLADVLEFAYPLDPDNGVIYTNRWPELMAWLTARPTKLT